jgi:hypothetical protein
MERRRVSPSVTLPSSVQLGRLSGGLVDESSSLTAVARFASGVRPSDAVTSRWCSDRAPVHGRGDASRPTLPEAAHGGGELPCVP